jgi:hypothetical protein
MCQTRGMSDPTTIRVVVAIAALATGAVFVAALRSALRGVRSRARELQGPALPEARVADRTARRWFRGRGRDRARAGAQLAQAAMLAVAITSVFVMSLCAVGIVGAIIFGVAR